MRHPSDSPVASIPLQSVTLTIRECPLAGFYASSPVTAAYGELGLERLTVHAHRKYDYAPVSRSGCPPCERAAGGASVAV